MISTVQIEERQRRAGWRATVQQETTTVELRYTKQDYVGAKSCTGAYQSAENGCVDFSLSVPPQSPWICQPRLRLLGTTPGRRFSFLCRSSPSSTTIV